MASDALLELLQATIAVTVALGLVASLRRPLRRWLGAQAVYASWAMVPLAALAVLLPARSGGTVLPAVAGFGQALPGIAAAQTSLPLAVIVMVAWLAGALALGMLMFVRQQRFQGGVRRQPDQANDTSDWATPAVTGLLRPRIVLPADFGARYTPEEQRLVLAHEQLHIDRGDIPAQAVATLLRCVFWFHPLVHAAAARFRFDQELACDAAVVARFPDSRRRYGDAMLKTQLAEFGLPVGCHWLSSHPLKERVAMLKQALPGPRRRRVAAALIASILTLASVVAWAAQPAEPAAAAPKPLQVVTDDDILTQPKYPAQALADGVSGMVWLAVLVGVDGVPREFKVMKSTPAGVFDKQAVAAARQWRFNAGRNGARGAKIEGWIRVPVKFTADAPPEGTEIE